jgi:L-lactate dehydrogenase complex protein LldE
MAEKTWELTSFLVDRVGLEAVAATLDASVTYHDACSGFHELGIREQPRRLLSSVSGLELREMDQPDQCCGFGGLFCVKYPQVSNRIAEVKIDAINATDADYVVAGDVGCLMQIEGKLHRLGKMKTRAVHVAEILADSLSGESDADD